MNVFTAGTMVFIYGSSSYPEGSIVKIVEVELHDANLPYRVEDANGYRLWNHGGRLVAVPAAGLATPPKEEDHLYIYQAVGFFYTTADHAFDAARGEPVTKHKVQR